MPDLKGQRALITGASSGIGAQMARVLASWGCDLIVTARRRDRLEALAGELEKSAGVSVAVIAGDLSTESGAETMWAEATADDRRIDILINNAGFGQHSKFGPASRERNLQMLQLNITSLVELTHRFIEHASKRDTRAYILNVSSIGAFQPVPNYANYSATKAYVLSFSEGIYGELKGTNISCTCLCPGATETEFFEAADQTVSKLISSSMMSAEKVARKGLLAMLKGKRRRTTGMLNNVNGFLLRFIPTGVAMWIASKVVGEPPPAKQLTSGSAESDAK